MSANKTRLNHDISNQMGQRWMKRTVWINRDLDQMVWTHTKPANFEQTQNQKLGKLLQNETNFWKTVCSLASLPQAYGGTPINLFWTCPWLVDSPMAVSAYSRSLFILEQRFSVQHHFADHEPPAFSRAIPDPNRPLNLNEKKSCSQQHIATTLIGTKYVCRQGKHIQFPFTALLDLKWSLETLLTRGTVRCCLMCPGYINWHLEIILIRKPKCKLIYPGYIKQHFK